MRKNKKVPFKVVMWDCSEEPNLSELSECARKGFVYFKYVDTEGDDLAVVCTKTPIPYPRALHLFSTWIEE